MKEIKLTKYEIITLLDEICETKIAGVDPETSKYTVREKQIPIEVTLKIRDEDELP